MKVRKMWLDRPIFFGERTKRMKPTYRLQPAQRCCEEVFSKVPHVCIGPGISAFLVGRLDSPERVIGGLRTKMHQSEVMVH